MMSSMWRIMTQILMASSLENSWRHIWLTSTKIFWWGATSQTILTRLPLLSTQNCLELSMIDYMFCSPKTTTKVLTPALDPQHRLFHQVIPRRDSRPRRKRSLSLSFHSPRISRRFSLETWTKRWRSHLICKCYIFVLITVLQVWLWQRWVYHSRGYQNHDVLHAFQQECSAVECAVNDRQQRSG